MKIKRNRKIVYVLQSNVIVSPPNCQSYLIFCNQAHFYHADISPHHFQSNAVYTFFHFFKNLSIRKGNYPFACTLNEKK